MVKRERTNTQSCDDGRKRNIIQKLLSNNTVDWIREEILCAKKYNKNILPVLIGKAQMPCNKAELPVLLRFLAELQAVVLPEQYLQVPFNKLISKFNAIPMKSRYQHVANSNDAYNVHLDSINTLEQAAELGDSRATGEILPPR